MEWNTANQEKFARIVNKLLNSTYLLKEQNRDEYAFICQNLGEFEVYLNKIGYELKNYVLYGIVQLRNKLEQGNRLKLKKVQSMLLLLLRILFLEEKNKTSDSSEVRITVGRLQDKYAMLDIKNKKNLDINTLKETLPIFKKYNLIDYESGLNACKSFEDFPIIIYYTICLSFVGEDIDNILIKTKETLDSYNREDEKNEANEDQAD